MPVLSSRLLAAAIFLAIEVPLAFIAYRASRRIHPLLIPAALLVLAVIVPDPTWGGLLLFVSLLASFAIAIGARVRKTRLDEEKQLALSGPSPWLGQSRVTSLLLIGSGAALMLVGTVADGSGRRNLAGVLLFAWGSIALGMGLFRRHTVLVYYLGRTRARWLEVVQVTTAITAYGLVTAAEFAADADQRFTLRLLSLIPFALHFLLVWLPLAKAEERLLMPEKPFA